MLVSWLTPPKINNKFPKTKCPKELIPISKFAKLLLDTKFKGVLIYYFEFMLNL